MKPAPFSYHRPTTLGAAVTLLTELALHDGRVLAGGQSLVPIMAFRLARPAHLIDINASAALDGLAVRNDKLCIGARVRHSDFHRPVGQGPLGAMLAAVVRHIALPHPLARHLLRQPCACGSGGGMVHRLSDAGCRTGRTQHCRRAPHGRA